MPDIPFNKKANQLRRADENEPENTRLDPKEIDHGGFSAHMARRSRAAKSRRKTSSRVRSSRHMKLVS